MEEARAVLARLERIETLEREGAGAPSLLAELRSSCARRRSGLSASATGGPEARGGARDAGSSS